MKETNWLKTLPSMRGPSWLADCLLAAWQPDWSVVIVDDEPYSSLLAIRVLGLKNNFPIVTHKSKSLNAVSNSIPIFHCGVIAITLV